MSMWLALLRLAEFAPRHDDTRVYVDFKANVKAELMSRLGTSLATYDDDGERKYSNRQPLRVLPVLYREVAILWAQHRDDNAWFGTTSDGSPYFNGAEQAMLRVLADDGSISGKQYLEPFKAYHDPGGSGVFEEISRHARRERPFSWTSPGRTSGYARTSPSASAGGCSPIWKRPLARTNWVMTTS